MGHKSIPQFFVVLLRLLPHRTGKHFKFIQIKRRKTNTLNWFLGMQFHSKICFKASSSFEYLKEYPAFINL